jgi:putative ABC transport system permease protein
MIRATLRTAIAHKGRLALSTIAVVLGVAFITGTLMLTNALDRTFVDVIEGSAQDVQVTRGSAAGPDLSSGRDDAAPLVVGQSVVERIRAVPGVLAAEGSVTRNGVYLLAADGDVVGAVGPPALGVNWPQTDAVSVATVVDGRAPAAGNEIAVDDATFPKVGIAVGDRVQVITPKGKIRARLVGVFRFGETGGLAGATITAFSSPRAQELLTQQGQWTAVDVAVADGVSDGDVADAIRRELGGGRYEVKTRAEQVADQSDSLREGLSFFNYFLIGFAAVSLFVAAFLIYNTFTMLVAQRSRELALLRAIGATRRQVMIGVIAEAGIVGAVAVAIGIGVGYLFAVGLGAFFGSIGLSLTAGIGITPAAVLWAAAVGLAVTCLSAILPAVRGSRIAPVAALRDAGGGAGEQVGRIRLCLGLVISVAAVLLMWTGLGEPETGPRTARAALGSFLLLVGVLLLAPGLGVAMIKMLAPIMRVFGGTSGTLAARNGLRAPRRLATTASALTIGVALVVSVTVVTVSARDSLAALIERSLRADLLVATQTAQPFQTAIADDIRTIPGVQRVYSESGGPARVDGGDGSVTAVGGGPLDAVYDVEVVAGRFDTLGSREAVVSSDLAADEGWQVGDSVAIAFPGGQRRSLTIVGEYESNSLLTGLVIDLDAYRDVGGAQLDRQLYVVLDEGVAPADVLPAVEDAASANPLVEVLDQTEIKERNAAQLNQLLYFVYALLGLSVLIAALGVVNTLTLSVVERTGEIGLLRAVGATRRQIRRIVRWEAVVVAVLGAVLGIAVGVVAGVALQRALADAGIDRLLIPTGTLVSVGALALIIGVLASVLPARRASRLNILDAVAQE